MFGNLMDSVQTGFGSYTSTSMMGALSALFAYIASQLVLRRRLQATAKLPFGLFFAPAIWICWLLGALVLQG